WSCIRLRGREKARRYLSVLNCASRERVVVGDVRAPVGLGYAEVGEQEGGRRGGHARAAIGVDRELPAVDPLLAARFLNEPLGQRGALAVRHHPADDVATEAAPGRASSRIAPAKSPRS